MLTGYKDALPIKAKREFYPQLIWIAPPLNKNFANNHLRSIYMEVLENCVESYAQMCCLKLIKIWDEEDGSLYRKDQRQFTPDGYQAYWSSIDASVKFWHKTLSEILIKKQKKSMYSLTNRIITQKSEKPKKSKQQQKIKSGLQKQPLKSAIKPDNQTSYGGIRRIVQARRKLPTPPPRVHNF